MKPEKSFGEIWSELTQEQSEYLKGYINRQRIDAINIHEKVSANQIEKLQADKEELLERLKEINSLLNNIHLTDNRLTLVYNKNRSLIQKMKKCQENTPR